MKFGNLNFLEPSGPLQAYHITASHKLRFRKRQKAKVTKVESCLVITKWYQVKKKYDDYEKFPFGFPFDIND